MPTVVHNALIPLSSVPLMLQTQVEDQPPPPPHQAISPRSISTLTASQSKSPAGEQLHHLPIALPYSGSVATTSAARSEPNKKRKPSPGLAARLKALGFGGDSPSKAPSASQEHIGRLPEDTYERLLHRDKPINPLEVQLVERRGRAWSTLSRARSDTCSTVEIPTGEAPATKSVSTSVAQSRRPLTGTSTKMDGSACSEPMAVDAQKYRLPEHIGGNGTKTLAETKQAHLDRALTNNTQITDTPPTPLPKDTPPTTSDPGFDPTAYFNPLGLQRAGSIYTLSRVSFASQLAQLTSLQLPDADSLSSRVAAIPTSKAASKALMGAADQIRSWISKASEVISGLDGEDDVEWAAAGGREGLEDVDGAITRFEHLIRVYVTAMDALQKRPDVATLSLEELKQVVARVEVILEEWESIKRNLNNVKISVEIAMEWEELWNTVLGDIGNEMDVLSRLVFEMEEKRHQSLVSEPAADSVNIVDLELIVEDTPPAKTRLQANNRSIIPPFPLSPNSPTTPIMTQDDSSLLALFARMQPLRASLDFLPMRLSTFHARAEHAFPTACEELESRRTGLEASYKNLEKDAESLRRELGEDRWVLVFRGAGRQAQKMCESVERSRFKLQEAIEGGVHLNNPSTMGKKIESYEAKKMHYGPAIERILIIIEKSVKDRVTVNGEILRLHSDMQREWQGLKQQMQDLDALVEDIQDDSRNQQLRDSMSSVISNDRSTLRSYGNTPGSSPASSVVMGLTGGLDPAVAQGPNRSVKSSRPSQTKERSGSTLSPSNLPRASPGRGTYGTPPPGPKSISTPTSNGPLRPGKLSPLDSRPRWNASTSTRDTMIGHNFKPLSLTTPSPHAKAPPSTHSSKSNRFSSSHDSRLPFRSPLSRENTASPPPHLTPSRPSFSRLGTRESASPGPYAQDNMRKSTSSFRRQVTTQQSMSSLNSHRPPLHSETSKSTYDGTLSGISTPKKSSRPASSMALGRRTSNLPTPKSEPKGRKDSSVTGRESPHAVAGAATAMRRNSSSFNVTGQTKSSERRPWR